MYFEALAQQLADHLGTHIEDYLEEVNAQFSKPITLQVPKSIEPASIVGGMMTAFDEILPQYGIDILGKVLSESNANLWEYDYTGQLNGLVHGTSRQSVDSMIARHAAAVELFMRRHQFLHQYTTPDFRVLGFFFAGVDFSGAEDLGADEGGRNIWLAGFSMNFIIFTSEDGVGQHA